MAKRKSVGSRPSWTGKYAGCKFLFAGKQSFLYKSTAIALLKLYGAKVCEKLDQSIDYLVTGQSGKAAAKLEQQAVKLNGSSTASIQIVDEAEFHRLLRPTPQEAVEMLKTARGRKAWEELRRHLEEFQVDLSGKRFRGVDFSDTWLRGCDLDGTDFRKANLKGIVLPAMCDAKFDGANLQECSPAGWTDCSFKKADLSDGSFYYYRGYFEGNDFTDATMLRMGSDGTQLSHSIFKNANLSEAVLPRIEAVNCDFTGAKMMDANFRESDFSKSKFCRADLSGSAFSESNFKGADLRKAVLRHADLESCDLTGAKLDGADFTGAMLLGAKIPKTAEKKAKGLIDRPLLKKAGPAIKKLLQVASSAASLRTSATLKTESGSVQMTFEVQAKFYGEFESLLTLDGKTKPRRFHVPSGYGNRTPLEPIWMTSVSRFCGELDLDSIVCSSSKCKLKGKALRDVVTSAWCESFGIELPSPEEVKAAKKAQKTTKRTLRQAMMTDLVGGAAGVKKWNRLTAKDFETMSDFRRSDLSGQELAGVKFKASVDFQSANFASAVLKKASIQKGAQFNKANFDSADLRDAAMRGVQFDGASFKSADLRGATLTTCSLVGCDFSGAKMADVDLSRADIRGADLSTAKLKGKLTKTMYDEKTRFPKSFRPTADMNWKGHGVPPDQRKKRPAAAKIDMPTLMTRLSESVDASRLDKALKMLKADSFQLYFETEAEHLTGIVKSQSEKKLLYSCFLDSAGGFSCCSQNLNTCGGLRGALCKHLLVLIIGLAERGEIDAATVDRWVAASQINKPMLDKERMAAVVLRYKGAEAGEVDWRPAETTPEDFYAF